MVDHHQVCDPYLRFGQHKETYTSNPLEMFCSGLYMCVYFILYFIFRWGGRGSFSVDYVLLSMLVYFGYSGFQKCSPKICSLFDLRYKIVHSCA